MSYLNQPSGNQRGFTLVELLVVIAVISILGGLIFSISSGVFGRGDRSRASSELQAISVALESYRSRFGDYPKVSTPRAFFDALDGKIGPTGGALSPNFPPFLEMGQFSIEDENSPELLDPWGMPYEYLYVEPDPLTRVSGYKLYSKGPDGQSSQEGDGRDQVDHDNIRYRD